MTEYVWVAAKPGEERRYASATGWSPEFVQTLKREGYTILRVSYEPPPWFGLADEAVAGNVEKIQIR